MGKMDDSRNSNNRGDCSYRDNNVYNILI